MKKLLNHQAVKYLIFGLLTTLVYLLARELLFYIIQQATLAAIIANIIAILFAFMTNDRLVFNQSSEGWPKRLVKFIGARLSTLLLDLLLVILLVERFPQIIGQFVHNDPIWINRIETWLAQALIILANYFLSKVFVFNNTKS
ncbi:GtrA family protein [Streptococcus cuniculipharyngis]|uniref:GtrA family protein n=1 Tax=Streptococcus cuniculipharyngis TaxID=1562651 RepID=A0A5C5SDJ2_9STRE|nr:GtrA family protein [Streptococcus cuniculipharyngis]TWS98033.1 GtrA family protein [Streptococcus cuniculipharyngis]